MQTGSSEQGFQPGEGFKIFACIFWVATAGCLIAAFIVNSYNQALFFGACFLGVIGTLLFCSGAILRALGRLRAG